MRLLQRNLTPVWYCLYKDKKPLLDNDGNETGEYTITYHKPVKMMCNVSSATGQAQMGMFGNLDSYDKVIIVDNANCPIDENSVLFIDRKPGFNQGKPTFDYTVSRVAKSLNSVSIAVSKVKVS